MMIKNNLNRTRLTYFTLVVSFFAFFGYIVLRRTVIDAALYIGEGGESVYVTSWAAKGTVVLSSLLLFFMVLYVSNRVYDNKMSVVSYFVFMFIFLTVIYFLLFPVWGIPDSKEHYSACLRYSNILLGRRDTLEWTARADELNYRAYINTPRASFYIVRWKLFHFFEADATLCEMEPQNQMKFYSILNYLPQVLGLTLGRLFHLGAQPTIFLGRIFMALVYGAIIVHCIRIIPVGKSIIATVALLPTCMTISSSVSYDAMVFITAMALTANIVRLYEAPNLKEAIVETGIWAFIAGGVKGGSNLLLLLMLITIPSIKTKYGKKAVFSILTAGLLSVILFDIVIPRDSFFQLGQEGTGKLTAGYALANPSRYIAMTVSTYLEDMDEIIFGMGGSWLSWSEETIPCFIVAIHYVFSVILYYNENKRLVFKKEQKKTFLIIILLFIFLTPALLLSYTLEGAEKIRGLQGRYYLPILPLIMFLCPNKPSAKFNGDNIMTDQTIVNKIGQMTILWTSVISVFYMMYHYGVR